MTRNINAPLPGTFVSCLSGDTSCTPSTGIRPYADEGNLYQFESGGLFNQNQLITNLNLRMGTRVSLFGFYSLNFARSNTAGVSSFPSDSYDIALDYGRAAFDVRNRLFLGGSFSLPKGIRLSPFMMANSGSPFNITTGQDNNGDSIFNDRPAYAAAGAAGTNIIATRWGTFDTNPQAGERIIPINLGTGPGQFSAELPAEQDDRPREENRGQNSQWADGAPARRRTRWTAGRRRRRGRRSRPRRAEQQRRTWRPPGTERKLSLQPDIGNRSNERLQHREPGSARGPTEFTDLRQIEFAGGRRLRPPGRRKPPDRFSSHVQLLIPRG